MQTASQTDSSTKQMLSIDEDRKGFINKMCDEFMPGLSSVFTYSEEVTIKAAILGAMEYESCRTERETLEWMRSAVHNDSTIDILWAISKRLKELEQQTIVLKFPVTEASDGSDD